MIANTPLRTAVFTLMALRTWRIRPSPLAMEDSTSWDHSFITETEQFDLELSAKLRTDGMIIGPGTSFEQCRGQISGLTARGGVLWGGGVNTCLLLP